VNEPESVVERRAGFVDTLKAVSASFFGVRGSRAHERDMARLNPLYVIVVGVLLTAAFVAGLILIVRSVVA
jgi:hypothetical protein